jgi:hypothetical protein
MKLYHMEPRPPYAQGSGSDANFDPGFSPIAAGLA